MALISLCGPADNLRFFFNYTNDKFYLDVAQMVTAILH